MSRLRNPEGGVEAETLIVTACGLQLQLRGDSARENLRWQECITEEVSEYYVPRKSGWLQKYTVKPSVGMKKIVQDSGTDAQKALLCAHPDLAGKAAIAGELTAESTEEQASAGLGSLTPEEMASLRSIAAR